MIPEEKEEIISQAITLLKSLVERPDDEQLKKVILLFIKEHGEYL